MPAVHEPIFRNVTTSEIMSSPGGWFTTLVNCRLCINGTLTDSASSLVVSEDTGLFLKRTGYIGGEVVDLEDAIVAPGFLELHTNGLLGFHFTHWSDEEKYSRELERVSKGLVEKGVTGFWPTLPTVEGDVFKKILPSLKPRSFPESAAILGAHCEGPYLQSSKKGAHNASLFQLPSKTTPEDIYGGPNLLSSIKLVTLAPELPGSDALISDLTKDYNIRVSLGHSDSSYEQGLSALSSGATCLTHLFNAMPPLHHRSPSLYGLLSLPPSNPPPAPYYSIIADGVHLHPSVLSLAYHINPSKCMLITDSVELAGLPDGVYPGHAQIPHQQRKAGAKVTIEGTDTLVGGAGTLDEGVRNLMKWSGCGIAEAVRCVTENVAECMGLRDRGKLEEGRRADFVVLSDEGDVLQTWIGGMKVWEKR